MSEKPSSSNDDAGATRFILTVGALGVAAAVMGLTGNSYGRKNAPENNIREVREKIDAVRLPGQTTHTDLPQDQTRIYPPWHH